jgi:hypothetical protein
MPIEVKQLVVKGVVQRVAESDAQNERPAIDVEEMKAEILEACRSMMEELLRESRER